VNIYSDDDLRGFIEDLQEEIASYKRELWRRKLARLRKQSDDKKRHWKQEQKTIAQQRADRRGAIVMALLGGLKRKEVAEKFGIGGGRVYQIYQQFVRQAERYRSVTICQDGDVSRYNIDGKLWTAYTAKFPNSPIEDKS